MQNLTLIWEELDEAIEFQIFLWALKVWQSIAVLVWETKD